jgi:hypothetical protein
VVNLIKSLLSQKINFHQQNRQVMSSMEQIQKLIKKDKVEGSNYSEEDIKAIKSNYQTLTKNINDKSYFEALDNADQYFLFIQDDQLKTSSQEQFNLFMNRLADIQA